MRRARQGLAVTAVGCLLLFGEGAAVELRLLQIREGAAVELRAQDANPLRPPQVAAPPASQPPQSAIPPVPQPPPMLMARRAPPRPEPIQTPAPLPTVMPAPDPPQGAPAVSSLQAGRVPGLPQLPPAEDQRFTDPDAMLDRRGLPELPEAADSPDRMRARTDAAQAIPPAGALTLEDVLRSVEQDYPLLAIAFAERGITAGEALAAASPWNTQFNSYNKTYPLSGYRYTVSDTYLEQPTWWGGETWAGYRIGTGDVPIWYGERQTNPGGEFRAGYAQSLLQGFAIDKQRASYIKAQLERSHVEPTILRQRIDFLQSAANAYWSWLAAGRHYVVAQQVLKVAEDRDRILAERAKLQDIAPIEQVDNQRIVVDRRAKLIASGRKFQETGIKLSLFYRDSLGAPQLPAPQQLPHLFPAVERPRPERLEPDLQLAQQLRPEFRQLAIKRQSVSVSLRLAQNQMLPSLDGSVAASQDLGPEKPGFFKGPFELETGLVGSVPLQRSAARGGRQAAQAELAQLNAKTRWTQDKVGAEVRDAMSALIAAHDQLQPARQAVQLAYRLEVAERDRYELGDSNLFVVNLRELATAEAALLEIDAIAHFFQAVADYRAALGLDGLTHRQYGALGAP